MKAFKYVTHFIVCKRFFATPYSQQTCKKSLQVLRFKCNGILSLKCHLIKEHLKSNLLSKMEICSYSHQNNPILNHSSRQFCSVPFFDLGMTFFYPLIYFPYSIWTFFFNTFSISFQYSLIRFQYVFSMFQIFFLNGAQYRH